MFAKVELEALIANGLVLPGAGSPLLSSRGSGNNPIQASSGDDRILGNIPEELKR